MVTITYAPLGPQYGAMQSLHYVQDDAVWLNMIEWRNGGMVIPNDVLFIILLFFIREKNGKITEWHYGDRMVE